MARPGAVLTADRESRTREREVSAPADALRVAASLMRQGDTAGALAAFARVDFELVRSPKLKWQRFHHWPTREKRYKGGRWWRLTAAGDGRAMVACVGNDGQEWAANNRRPDACELYFDDLAEALEYVAGRACGWRWRPNRG